MIREKATLRELSDRLQAHTAIDKSRRAYVYNKRPYISGECWFSEETYYCLYYIFDIDYTGDWKDSLHSPQHQYVEGELVWVWLDREYFAHVRKVKEVKRGKMYTFYPNDERCAWDHHRKYDASLLGVPIAEWPEEQE